MNGLGDSQGKVTAGKFTHNQEHHSPSDALDVSDIWEKGYSTPLNYYLILV